MDFVEICNVYVGKMIIKVAKRIFNSDKICCSYSDLNFGVTFLEHSVYRSPTELLVVLIASIYLITGTCWSVDEKYRHVRGRPADARQAHCTWHVAVSAVRFMKNTPDSDRFSSVMEIDFSILLANVNSCSRSLYVVVPPSVCLSVVCLSSVTFVHSTQPIEIFGNVSAPFNTLVT